MKRHSYSYGSRRKRRRRGGRLSRSMAGPILKLSVLVLLVAAAIAAFFIFALPLLTGEEKENPEDSIKLNEFRDPTEQFASLRDDQSSVGKGQVEAAINYKTINDAYMSGGEIVFSTASVKGGVSVYDKLVVYNCETKENTELPDVTIKYDNILQTRINQNYIVFLDSHPQGGGRIMCYDRGRRQLNLIKEYVYAAPQLSLYENTLVFMQQAGEHMDKLYAVHLPTRESTCLGVYQNVAAPSSSAHIYGNKVVCAIHYQTDGVYRSLLHVFNLDTGEETTIDPLKFVYNPQICGEDIAFVSTATNGSYDLYLSQKGELPVLIDSGVTNYGMGSGYVAYTKDENIYACPLDTKVAYQLNSSISTGLLTSVYKDSVAWYDVTSGYAGINVVKYSIVE